MGTIRSPWRYDAALKSAPACAWTSPIAHQYYASRSHWAAVSGHVMLT
jgi:hypothetical protein